MRFINKQPEREWDEHIELVTSLLNNGANPCKRNVDGKLKPIELADPRNKRLRATLAEGEKQFLAEQGADVVVVEADEKKNEGRPGSASDND